MNRNTEAVRNASYTAHAAKTERQTAPQTK